MTYKPDLALVTTTEPFRFSETVGPVCVPSSLEFHDHPAESEEEEDMMSYVAGWGAQFSFCDTNGFGPQPHTMCKFPFSHGGEAHDRHVSS